MFPNYPTVFPDISKIVLSSVCVLAFVYCALQIDFAMISYIQLTMSEEQHLFWKAISEFGQGTIYFTLCFIGLLVGYFGQLFSSFKARSLFEFSSISLFSFISAGLVIRIVKWGFGRPRPKIWLETDISQLSPFSFLSELNAFPSGHTQTAFTVAFLLCLLFPRYKWFFYMAALMVGISRVALLKHWPSDVVMGAYIGVLLPFYTTVYMRRFFKGAGFTAFRFSRRSAHST